MGAMPWPTEYMFAVNHDHALHPHEWPPAEAILLAITVALQ